MAGPSTEGLAVSAAITAELWPGGFKKLKGGPGLEQTYTVRARPLMEWPAGGACCGARPATSGSLGTGMGSHDSFLWTKSG